MCVFNLCYTDYFWLLCVLFWIASVKCCFQNLNFSVFESVNLQYYVIINVLLNVSKFCIILCPDMNTVHIGIISVEIKVPCFLMSFYLALFMNYFIIFGYISSSILQVQCCMRFSNIVIAAISELIL